MSLNIKHQPKIFRILDYRHIADLILILFLTDDYLTLILTCKRISNYLRSKVTESMWALREKFKQAYSDLLNLKHLSLKSDRFWKNKKEYKKIDIVLEFSPSDKLSKSIYALMRVR